MPPADAQLAAVVRRAETFAEGFDRLAAFAAAVVAHLTIALSDQKILFHEASLSMLDSPRVNAEDSVHGRPPGRQLGETDDHDGYEDKALWSLVLHYDTLNACFDVGEELNPRRQTPVASKLTWRSARVEATEHVLDMMLGGANLCGQECSLRRLNGLTVRACLDHEDRDSQALLRSQEVLGRDLFVVMDPLNRVSRCVQGGVQQIRHFGVSQIGHAPA
jgi:hypothetical protein